MARMVTLVFVGIVLLVGLELCTAQGTGADPTPAPEPGTPTSEPSAEPTPEVEPSTEPEPGPTREPEGEPSPSPEVEPTSEPSAEPTPEVEPSAEPERGPTSEPEGEPSPNPEAEATSEPEPTPESGAEPEPSPEPDGEPEPEPESNNISDSGSPFAEPVPAWDVAIPMYDWAWPFHIYFMGVLFALLAVYSLGAIIKLRQRRLLSYGYFITLNLLMLLMGVIRAVYLLVDAYNYKGIWPDVVAYLFLGTGFPCLTSAFSILFLALLQSTKTRLVPPTVQKPKVLAIVVIGHFAFSFIADVVVGMNASAAALLLACQATFVVWGLFLVISYLVIFRRLHRSSQRKFREFTRLSKRTASVVLPGERRTAFKPKNNWGSAIRLTLVTAVLGFLIVLLQLYGMLVVYGPVGGQKAIPDPWPWWSYQFIFRVMEFLMCALMSIIATQPFRYDKDGKGKPSPCTTCWNALCVACGRKEEEEDFTQDEALNSQVWSSAFEPCLPRNANMYPGMAESSDQEKSNACLINMNGNNSSVNVNASVNVHTEENANADKLKDFDMKLDPSLTQDPPGMKRSKSTELIASRGEMNNETRTPQTAPPGSLMRAPFTETLPISQGQVVKNQLESPEMQSDKGINCQSGDMIITQDKQEIMVEVDDMKPELEEGLDHGLSGRQLDISCSSPKGDISLDVTETSPLNPEH